MNVYKDKIYYTEDIYKLLEEKGLDACLIEKIYVYYIDFLREQVSTTDTVAYYLPSLGTLYLTHIGANAALNKFKTMKTYPRFKYHDRADFLIDLYEKKLKKIGEYITILQNAGVKKIMYFKRYYKPFNIKNNG